MGYSKEIYRRALEEKEAQRRAAERRAEENRQAAYAALPRLEEIDRQLAEKGARLAPTALSGGDLAALEAACGRLTAEKEALLAGKGFRPADFQPAYACGDCKDTGKREGRLCGCVHRIARRLAYEQLSAALPLEESRFDKFDLSYYPDAGRPAPRKRMAEIFAFCKQYAEGFTLRSESLLFFGNTGLGKTHLSLAIGRAVLEKGYGVLYGSAQDLLGMIEREHFGRSEGDTLEDALGCDLLILDDLGTEFSTPFNLSVVNNLVGARLLTHRPTIISTNLDIPALEERYTPRVASRIIGSYVMKGFLGPDVRQQKRMQEMRKDK